MPVVMLVRFLSGLKKIRVHQDRESYRNLFIFDVFSSEGLKKNANDQSDRKPLTIWFPTKLCKKGLYPPIKFFSHENQEAGRWIFSYDLHSSPGNSTEMPPKQPMQTSRKSKFRSLIKPVRWVYGFFWDINALYLVPVIAEFTWTCSSLRFSHP